MSENLEEHSMESRMSRILYELNQELLFYKKEAIREKTNSFNLNNIKVLFAYIKEGAFERIIRRIKNVKNGDESQKKYSLLNYESYPEVKVAVYTCIWGKYDNILEPYFVNPDIDYFIITDMNIPKDSVWEKLDISKFLDTKQMSPIEVNRFCKILPHRLFSEYDYSIYIDGNIRIVTDMFPIISDMSNHILGIHDYQVDCIYNMKDAIIAGKRAKKAYVLPQIQKYKTEGFPENFGAFECNVLVRKHMDAQCQKLMEDWWNEFNNTTSKRDQLSLPYVLWKNNMTSNCVKSLGHHVRENPRFQVGLNHKKSYEV